MSNWVRVLRRMGGLATISWVVCVMFSLAAHAQSFNITNLTAGSATKASFPNMVVDGKGNTYLAWIDTSKGGIVVASHFDGSKFNAQFVITTAVLPAFQPQIAVRVVSGPVPIIHAAFAVVDNFGATQHADRDFGSTGST